MNNRGESNRHHQEYSEQEESKDGIEHTSHSSPRSGRSSLHIENIHHTDQQDHNYSNNLYNTYLSHATSPPAPHISNLSHDNFDNDGHPTLPIHNIINNNIHDMIFNNTSSNIATNDDENQSSSSSIAVVPSEIISTATVATETTPIHQQEILQSPRSIHTPLLNDGDNHEHHNEDSENDTIPLPPPPRPSEHQSAREHLIQREREARLERERARLKHQLALNRERDEEEEKFAAVDVARIGIGSDADDHHHSHDIDTIRDVVVDMNLRHHQDLTVEEHHDISIDSDHHSSRNDALIAPRHDTIGIGNILNASTSSPASSAVPAQLHPLTSAADGERAEGSAPSPLGFTMERFLSDGVIVGEAQEGDGRDGEININDTGINGGGDNDVRIASPIVPRLGTNETSSHIHATDNASHNTHTPLTTAPNQQTNNDSIISSDFIARDQDLDNLVPVEPHSPSSILNHGSESDVESTTNMIVGSVESIDHEEGGSNHQDEISGLQPRLAQLTEAEILELAEIDYASIGNMPPRSVRDETHLTSASSVDANSNLSGLGRMSNVFSEGTQTTLQESLSITSTVNRSEISGSDSSIIVRKSSSNGSQNRGVAIGGNNNDDVSSSEKDVGETTFEQALLKTDSAKPAEVIAVATNSSQNDMIEAKLSPRSDSDASVVVHRDEENDQDGNNSQALSQQEIADDLNWDINFQPPTPQGEIDGTKISYDDNTSSKSIKLKDPENDSHSSSDANDDTIPNRIIRPGIGLTSNSLKTTTTNASHRRIQTAPIISSFVDGFDFNKYDPPGKPSPPLSSTNGDSFRSFQDYGTVSSQHDAVTIVNSNRDFEEARPLILGPPQVSDVRSDDKDQEECNDVHHYKRENSLEQVVDSVFSSVRSLSTDDFQAESNDCDRYLESNILERAFPERFAALVVTLLIEIPVLIMIAGGSEELTRVIGQSRYQLLMAFLPLSSAISGNCGLQASTLATRAISHLHVTKDNYFTWLFAEMKVAFVLGVGMGTLLGLVAFYASGFDWAFGLVIFIANMISIWTAGLTGTLAPLIINFIFKRDSGKWGGPLETAVQDIIGTFSMVVLSCKLLILLGSDGDGGGT